MVLKFEKINRNERISLLSIATAFFLFYIFRMLSGNAKLSDSEDYLFTADSILNCHYFFKDWDFESASLKTRRPFLYPLFLAVFTNFKLGFVLLIQTLAGIFNAYLLLQLFKKLGGKMTHYFTLFFICTFSIFVYTQLIMSEWLAMLLFTLLGLLLTSPFSQRRFFWIQLITVLLAFTKPVFFPMIYLNLVYFSVFFIRKRIFTSVLFMPIVVLFLYLSFNQYRTGYAHFSSIENASLIDYNLYYYKSSTASKQIADDWVATVYRESEKFPDFKSRSVFIY